jgi:hypothetical protein
MIMIAIKTREDDLPQENSSIVFARLADLVNGSP